MLSRVADSLYWMSRYLERAEHTARLIDVNLDLMLDHGVAGSNYSELLLVSLNLDVAEATQAGLVADPYATARRLTFDKSNANSIVSCIVTARENARQIREQISTEMYEQLNRLYLRVRNPGIEAEWNAQPHEFYDEVKEAVHLFNGVTQETFAHGEAFFFIGVGKSLERFVGTADLVRAYAPSLERDEINSSSYLEWVALLKSCTSFEAYCREYTADLRPRRIIEFLLLEEEMPRSLRFCGRAAETALEGIFNATGRRRDSNLMRAAGRLRARLDYASTDEVLTQGLPEFLSEARRACNTIHALMAGTFIRYSIETAAAA